MKFFKKYAEYYSFGIGSKIDPKKLESADLLKLKKSVDAEFERRGKILDYYNKRDLGISVDWSR